MHEEPLVPVGVVVFAQTLDLLRERSVYWKAALLRKRSELRELERRVGS
jgi:hypothetical protein